MKILVISLSGIGNNLMYTPSLRLLRKRFPDAKIDVLVRKKPYGDVLYENKDATNVINFEDNMLSNFLRLYKENYDISIINFPSRKFAINLLSFLIHAKIRLGHKYQGFNSSFLQNRRILANPRLHDIEQNLELLKLIDVTHRKEDCSMILDSSSDFGKEFLKKNKISEKSLIIGIHAGSSLDHRFELKRWELNKFGELCNKLIKNHKAKILIFGGPEEKELKERLNNLISNNGSIVDANLTDTISLIKKCRLFITNDSGLMHIAVALNIKTIALFGPTSTTRTRPYGEKHMVIKKEGCDCFEYPFKTSSAKIKCKKNCLKKISSDEVYERIKNIL